MRGCRAICPYPQLSGGDGRRRSTFHGRRKTSEVALEEAMVAPQPDETELVDLRHALLVGLHQLPAGMRAVLVLRYWEGLSDAEVARELGRSVGTVKSQASRGLQRLRDHTTSRQGLSGALR